MWITARILLAAGLLALVPAAAQHPAGPPTVLALFTPQGETDHYLFAQQTIRLLGQEAATHGYRFVATSDWNALLAPDLAATPLVLFLNGEPETPAQRDAFRRYMTSGGGWLGFHISGFPRDDWPWFGREFLHAGFAASNWPALPARVVVERPAHPVTAGVPVRFVAPINEWYAWSPNPRESADVEVLMSLDRDDLPLGIKNVLPPGDVPVVWTNRRYRMLYVNYGHGDRVLSSSDLVRTTQNAVEWLLKRRSASR